MGRWLRFSVAVVAAVLAIILAGTIWLLSGQRYQTLLTEQLSQLLGAEVRVSGSRFSSAGGLGIELVGVTIQLPTENTPFLTAERFDMLLDLKALVYGHLLFHEMKALRPHIRVAGNNEQAMTYVLGLLATTEKTVAKSDTPGWFTPTLAVRHVEIYNGSVEYTRKVQGASFLLSQLQLLLSRPEGASVVLRGTAALGQKGELGAIVLQAVAPTWSSQLDQRQVAWHGSVQLRDVVAHQLGRVLGHEWPHATLSANLHYDGKGAGPVHIDGTMDARNLHAGAIHLRTVAGNIAQLQWAGRSNQKPSSTWREHLQAITAKVYFDQVQGGPNDRAQQFSLSKGTLTLHDGTLAVQGLGGDYGKKSHLLAGKITAPQFTSRSAPEVTATFEADVNLQEDLDELLKTLAKFGLASANLQVQQPRGRAAITLSLYSPRFPTALSFDGEVSLHQVAFRLPSIKPEVTDLTGKVRITNKLIETIAPTLLSLKLGESNVQVSGQVIDYASPQRKVDLHIRSDLALAELPELERGFARGRGASTKMEKGLVTQFVMNPQGRAQVQADVQTAVPSGVLNYEGTVALQQTEVTLPKWNLALNGLTGVVRIDKETLSTDGLTFGISGAPMQLKGVLHDYLTPQQNGEGTIVFTGVSDGAIAPLLPLKLVVPQGGTIEGKIDIRIPREGEMYTGGNLILNNLLLDPLPKVFHPLRISQGLLDWQGQNVNLMILQGSSAGGKFTGSGRVSHLSPLNLELTVDFANLDLGAAFNLDKSKVEDSQPKNDTVQVRVKLHADHLQYKTFAAEQVQASCYWHGRQADLKVIGAQTAGGTMKGDATLWPDSKALYLTPHVTGVDVSQALAMLGTPSNRVTGTLNGEGKIYFPDWHEWGNLARWRAQVSLAIADGTARQVPILVRLWSAVSLQELLSFQLPSLPNDGLAFSSLAGDFVFGNGMAITPNLSLASNSVRIEATGEIDLGQHTLDLKTLFMPLYGITSSVAKVPLAGRLLARGAEMLTTLLFRVYGPYHDPTVTPLVIDLGQR